MLLPLSYDSLVLSPSENNVLMAAGSGAPISELRKLDCFHQQSQALVQLEPVEGGACEEESALSNDASSLNSIAASRLSSFSSNFVRFSLSSSLICASIVGCQFNFANQRRQGGKEARNSDLLIDVEVDSKDIDMAVGSTERDQKGNGLA